VYLKQGRYAQAEKIFSQTLAILQEQQLGDTLNAGITRIKLGRALVRQRRYREAEAQLRQGCAIVAAKAGPSAEWITAVRPDFDIINSALGKNPDSTER
jgi:serine/threonine-protein kinase